MSAGLTRTPRDQPKQTWHDRVSTAPTLTPRRMLRARAGLLRLRMWSRRTPTSKPLQHRRLRIPVRRQRPARHPPQTRRPLQTRRRPPLARPRQSQTSRLDRANRKQRYRLSTRRPPGIGVPRPGHWRTPTCAMRSTATPRSPTVAFGRHHEPLQLTPPHEHHRHSRASSDVCAGLFEFASEVALERWRVPVDDVGGLRRGERLDA